MNIPVLYAKKIPVAVPQLRGKHLNFKKEFEVQLFTDPLCLNKKASYDYWYAAKPTKRNKYVTVNCAKYRLEWK